MDKKEELNTNQNNEYENTKIPKKYRKSFITILVLMLGYGLFPSTINTGAIVASSFDLNTFILIIFVGNLILTIYALLLSLVGVENGVSLHNLSKRIFGKKGYKITSMILIISQIGWFGVGVMLVSQSLFSLLGINNMEGMDYFISWLITMITGVLITSAAFFGVRALKVASLVAIPIVLSSGLLMTGLSFGGGEWGVFQPDKPNMVDITPYFAIGLVVSTFISGATLIPDFIRWAKSKTHAVVVVISTFFVLQIILLLFGAFAYYGIDNELFGEGTITLFSSLTIMGFGAFGFISLFFNVWTSNDNSLYSTGLAISSIYNVKKSYAVIGLGTVGTIFAPLFNTSGFLVFLNLLGYLIPGIGSILLADYFINSKIFLKEDKYFDFNHQYNNYNFVGISSWILGILVTVLIQVILPFIVPLYIILNTFMIYLLIYYLSNIFRYRKS